MFLIFKRYKDKIFKNYTRVEINVDIWLKFWNATEFQKLSFFFKATLCLPGT